LDIIIVAIGGAMGAVSRYLAGAAVSKSIGTALPYGTFVINILGCLCMGFFMTLISQRGMLSQSWRLFLCVGFLGGFTTFSSFGYESLTLFNQGKLLACLGYAGGSVLLGILAATAGVVLARIV